MRILVVEDDPGVRDALDRALRAQGDEVVTAGDGLSALATHRSRPADLIVLDLGLPGADGLSVCRRIRADADPTPILILTARDAVDDRVAGLDAGADDYLSKPFALSELLARLRALARRADRTSDPDAVLRFAEVQLDPDSRRAWRGDRELMLTDREFRLLATFLAHPRRVLTREQLLDAVWDPDDPPSANVLEVYVGYLRRKLEADGEARLLHTVRGVGYVARTEP